MVSRLLPGCLLLFFLSSFSSSASPLSRTAKQTFERSNSFFLGGVLLPGHGPQIFSGLSFRCPSPSSPSPSPHRSLAEASMSGRGSLEGSNRSQSWEEFKPRGGLN